MDGRAARLFLLQPKLYFGRISFLIHNINNIYLKKIKQTWNVVPIPHIIIASFIIGGCTKNIHTLNILPILFFF